MQQQQHVGALVPAAVVRGVVCELSLGGNNQRVNGENFLRVRIS
jgi:hypothetical protein